MPLSPSQRTRALSLYRLLLRTERKTFAGDHAAILAARAQTRKAFEDGRRETEEDKIEANLSLGHEIVRVLRANVVQGRWQEEKHAYDIRITPDTELGSNETIKRERERQIAELEASKGKSKGSAAGRTQCGEAGGTPTAAASS